MPFYSTCAFHFCMTATIDAHSQISLLFSSMCKCTFCVFLDEKCTRETGLKFESRGSNLGAKSAQQIDRTASGFWIDPFFVLLLIDFDFDPCKCWCLDVVSTWCYGMTFLSIGFFSGRRTSHIATDKVQLQKSVELIFPERRTTVALMLRKVVIESKLRYKTAPHSAKTLCKNFPLSRLQRKKMLLFLLGGREAGWLSAFSFAEVMKLHMIHMHHSRAMRL